VRGSIFEILYNFHSGVVFIGPAILHSQLVWCAWAKHWGRG